MCRLFIIFVGIKLSYLLENRNATGEDCLKLPKERAYKDSIYICLSPPTYRLQHFSASALDSHNEELWFQRPSSRLACKTWWSKLRD